MAECLICNLYGGDSKTKVFYGKCFHAVLAFTRTVWHSSLMFLIDVLFTYCRKWLFACLANVPLNLVVILVSIFLTVSAHTPHKHCLTAYWQAHQTTNSYHLHCCLYNPIIVLILYNMYIVQAQSQTMDDEGDSVGQECTGNLKTGISKLCLSIINL